MREIVDVGRSRKIALPPEVIDNVMQLADNFPEHGTASMRRDIMEGRSSELFNQNGAVVRLGREGGINTPINTFIYYSLLPQERRARGDTHFEL